MVVISTAPGRRILGQEMSIKSLKLYHYPLTRSVRVKWMLHEVVGTAFETEHVAVIHGAMMTPEMLTKNPNHNLPMLDITWDDGSVQTMLESGAMVLWLAEAFPDKGLAPTPGANASRADYLQMMQFGASWMDSMLWQIRLHRDLLPDSFKQKSVVGMYKKKWTSEIEPQLMKRLSEHDFVCGDMFNAADCIAGYNVFWASSYGLCSDPVFKAYLDRLQTRPAFQLAFADADQFGK